MTPSAERGLMWAAVVAAMVLLPARIPAQFRSSTDAVWVTATVTDKDGHLVTDLTKDDFEVRDRGEVRPITTFRSDRIPFAVSIMLDVSGSMRDNLGVVRRAVSELVRRFEPGDRANIGTFARKTEIMVSPQFSGSQQTLLSWTSATIGGAAVPCHGGWMIEPPSLLTGREIGSAVWNAAQCAIETVAGDAETPRRVVLLVTDGLDNESTISPAELVQQGNDYDVMIYAVGVPGEQGLASGDLRTIAESTGGGFFLLTAQEDMPAAFARIADELRRQYVFGIGQSAGGKPVLDVRARRVGTTTRARQVSLELNPLARAVPPPSHPAAKVPDIGASAGVASLATMGALDAFERGEWEDGDAPALEPEALLDTLKTLKRVVPAWVGIAGPEPQRQRRRLAAATYVLHLLRSQEDPYLWQGGGALFSYHPSLPAVQLVEWADSMLRGGRPLAAERWWHVAALGLLERHKAQQALTLHLTRARARFPDEDRWSLAQGVADELRTWPEPRDDRPFAPDSYVTSSITRGFEQAAGRASVRGEALIRLGNFELRRNQADAALARFAEAGEPEEPVLRYWLALFRGRALEQRGRLDEAIASYRAALVAAPYARSAVVALASALLAAHRDADAALLAARSLALRPAPPDPWDEYVFPDWRFWDRANTELKKAVTR